MSIKSINTKISQVPSVSISKPLIILNVNNIKSSNQKFLS